MSLSDVYSPSAFVASSTIIRSAYLPLVDTSIYNSPFLFTFFFLSISACLFRFCPTVNISVHYYMATKQKIQIGLPCLPKENPLRSYIRGGSPHTTDDFESYTTFPIIFRRAECDRFFRRICHKRQPLIGLHAAYPARQFMNPPMQSSVCGSMPQAPLGSQCACS